MAAPASSRALSVRISADADDFRRQLEQIGTDGQAQLTRIGDVDLSALRQQFEGLGQAANGNLQAATVAIGAMNVQIVQAGEALDRTAATAETFGSRLSGAAASVKGAAAGLDEFLASAKSINDVLRASWAVRTVQDTFVDLGSAAAGTAHEVDKVVERTIALRLAFGALRSYGLAVPGLQEIIAIGIAVEKTAGFIGAAVSANDNYIASHKRLAEVLERTNSTSGLTAGAIELAARRQEVAGRSTRQTLQTAAEAIIAYKGTTEQNFAAILAASDDLAAKLGKDVPDAAQTLVGWMGQGAAAFGAMEEAGIRVTYALEKQAVAFEAAGDKAGAAGVVLDAVKASVGGTSGAIDESAASVHRYEVAWTDLVTGVGALLGPFVEKLRAAWAFITAPIDWPRDIATSFMENLTDHLGTRPIAQQLERDQALLDKAIKERDRLLKQGGASVVEALSNAETNVYLLKQKVQKDKDGLAALGVNPDQVAADSRQLQATLETNARALDQWGARLSEGLTTAAGGPGLDAQIKAINTEFEKTRTQLDSHRNPDGSNDLKVDILIDDARRLADARIKAAQDEAKAQAEANVPVDEYADLLERLSEEGARLEKQRADRALQLFNQTVEAGLTPAERYQRQVAEMAEALELLRSRGFQPLPAEIAAINKALAEQDPAYKEAQRQAEEYGAKVEQTAKQVSGDWSKAIFDGLTGNGKKQSILDWFETLFKRIAVQALQANIVLPITTSIVGSVPSIFGITSSAASASEAAAGQSGIGSGVLSVGNLASKASGGWLDRQLGGGITSASSWLNTTAYGGSLLNTGAVQQTAAGLGTGVRELASPAMSTAQTGGVTYGDMLGGGLYGLNAIMNFSNGNVAGGIGNTAATIMSFIPGLQEFAPFVAIGSQLLSGLFGKNRGTPTAAATVTYDGTTQVASAYDQDNEGDLQQAAQLLQSIDAATAQFIAAAGGKTNGEFGLGVEAADGAYKVRTLTGEVGGGYGTLDEAVIAGFRRNVSDGLIEASDDVLKAVANSTKTDINEFMSDVSFAKSFRPQLDAMNAALDPVNNQIKTYTENAKQIGEAVKAYITDFTDTGSRLGLATESELTEAARKSITAMMGLGAASEPLRGVAAVTKQAEIEFEAYRPTLAALGYTTAEVADLATRYTAKMQAAYADAVGLLQRQASVSIAALDGRGTALSAADTFRVGGATLETVTAPAFAAITGQLDGLAAAARRGALTYDQVQRAWLALNKAVADGVLTADQYTTAVGLVTSAYDDSQSVLATLRGAWDQIATITSPGRQQTATDVLDGALIRGGGEGVPAFAAQLDALFGAIRDGTASYGDLAYTYEQAAALFRAGTITGEQFNSVVAAMTSAWGKAAAAAAYQANVTAQLYAAVGEDRIAALLGLQAQQAAALAQATAAGYDTALLTKVQAEQYAAKAFELAQQDVTGALDQQIAATQAWITSLSDGAVKIASSAREFRQAYDALALNDNSPLNAFDRLEEARRQIRIDYATYKDAAANDNDRDAAKQDLLSLLPSLVDLAKGFYGSTDDTDYEWARDILAEFGDAKALGVDTAEEQLATAQSTLKTLQKARDDAVNYNEKQYGKLDDLYGVMYQSYVVLQGFKVPLEQMTGTKSSASVDQMVAGMTTATLPGIVTWAKAQGADATYQVLRAADERLGWQNNPYRYSSPAELAGLGQYMSTDDFLEIMRSIGYVGDVGGANPWLVAYGKSADYETAVRAWARDHGIAGFERGGVIANGVRGRDSVLARYTGGGAVLLAGGEGIVTAAAMDRLGDDGLAELNAGRWPANDRVGPAALRPRAVAVTGGGSQALLDRLDRVAVLLETLIATTADGDSDNAAATRAAAVELKQAFGDRAARPVTPVGLRRAGQG